MIHVTSSSSSENGAAETAVEFTARLWLRTAVVAWLCWLVPLGAAMLARGLR